jgi:hypothetical protein
MNFCGYCERRLTEAEAHRDLCPGCTEQGALDEIEEASNGLAAAIVLRERLGCGGLWPCVAGERCDTEWAIRYYTDRLARARAQLEEVR